MIGALWLLVTLTPIVDWGATLLSGDWKDASGEVLVVLSGSTMGHGVLGDSSDWRAVYAVQVWREGSFKKILLTGRSAAIPMKNYLLAHGVEEDVILVEDEATTTRENASKSREILKEQQLRGPVVVLTSDYHVFRAQRVFRQEGMEVQTRALPDLRKRSNLVWQRFAGFQELMVEVAKIGYYKVRGWI